MAPSPLSYAVASTALVVVSGIAVVKREWTPYAVAAAVTALGAWSFGPKSKQGLP